MFPSVIYYYVLNVSVCKQWADEAHEGWGLVVGENGEVGSFCE